MKIKEWLYPTIIVSVIVLGIMLVGFFAGNTILPDEPVVSSVARGGEYHATNTRAITGTLYKAAQTRHLIKTAEYSSVVLGSVVIASTTDNAMSIYNATSSEAVVDGTYGTLITTFPASAPQGTYTFDIALNSGLVVDMAAGFGGDFCITFK